MERGKKHFHLPYIFFPYQKTRRLEWDDSEGDRPILSTAGSRFCAEAQLFCILCSCPHQGHWAGAAAHLFQDGALLFACVKVTGSWNYNDFILLIF